MREITQIRKLSIWIFFIPLLAINLCLFISQNPEFLESTFLKVDMIGRSGFSIPYIDGSLSISRASRTFPQYLIFKPSMIFTAILLYFYWKNNNDLVNKLNTTNKIHKFRTFGILSAIFLAIHSIFLGIKFDYQIYKLLRRVVFELYSYKVSINNPFEGGFITKYYGKPVNRVNVIQIEVNKKLYLIEENFKVNEKKFNKLKNCFSDIINYINLSTIEI